MIELLLILTPLAAGLVILGGASPGWGRLWLLAAAPLPALVYSVLGDTEGTATVEWLLLESHFGLVHTGQVFLFLTAFLWTVAGAYAIGYLQDKGASKVFCGFWLATLTGNLGVVLAGDVPSFYTFFALMTFSAYGLVVKSGTREAWRAGRIYIILALVGEAMMIGAFLLAVAAADSFLLADVGPAVAGSPDRDLIVLLILAGFGVKAGVLPLHLWLPLAHPVAPAPASAVLSGVIIKAGLIGWIHLLPGGYGAFPGWSWFLMALGFATAFYGVICGLFQDNLKTMLAYSSISQMGLMLVVLGAGLTEPPTWEGAIVVLPIYALNHAFSKGALFLGADISAEAAGCRARARRWILLGLAVPALSIAGGPLMGGAVAKDALKLVIEGPGHPWVKILLPLTTVATTVLLGRFLVLARRELRGTGNARLGCWDPRIKLGGWVVLVAAAAGGVYVALLLFRVELPAGATALAGIRANFWPILAGAFMLGLGQVVLKGMRPKFRVPPGDLLLVFERLLQKPDLGWIVGAERLRINFYPGFERLVRSPGIHAAISRSEVFLGRKKTAGFLMIGFVLVMLFLLR